MKSKLYTTVCSVVSLLAAFSVNKAYSGGGPIYEPAEYRTYRVYDYSKTHDLDEYYGRWLPKQPKSKITQNCELWQELTYGPYRTTCPRYADAKPIHWMDRDT